MPNCPVCKESRYKKKTKAGKLVAKKIVRYFPLTPRLQRMFNTKHIAKWMTWHATGQSKEKGKMNHPCDGRAWKYFDMMKPEFSGDARNVRLGLAADGFNPFGMMSQTYSMWPVILTTYNTPPWMCMKETSLMLTMLIPGPKSPAKDIDVYLQPLIKELQELWKGVWTKDAATGTHFQMKAALLWTINDFPARSSLSGWSGQGYYACPTCNVDTPLMAVKNKIANVEPTPKPRKFSELEIQLQISKVLKRRPGKHPDIAKKNPKPNREIELNWSKRFIFWDLEYWPFLKLKHNLDVMHIEKNALEALLNTLLQNNKTKDTVKARQDLETLKVQKELWLVKKPNEKLEKPHPKYSFTTEGRKRFCKFIKGVRLPDGFGSNFKQKVTADDNNITGMKSHDCHIMMHRLLPYGVQQYLPKSIAAPIIEFCLFFKQLCARTLMQQDMSEAKKQSISILIELEQIFPPAFFDIMIHVAIHLPDEAILGGPIRYRWMFPFERYMKKLKNYVRNKAKPEGSIVKGYVAEEALTFCSCYLKDDVETRFNRLGRNDDGLLEDEPDKFQVFRSVCKPTGRMKETRLTTDVMQAVVWFVLNNSPEVEADILAYRDYVSSFFYFEKSSFSITYPNIMPFCRESPDNVETSFPAWFNYKVVEHVYHRDVAESDQDVIHGSSSSHVTLSVGLTCLEHTNLSINSESTEVDAPPVNDDNANANEGNAEDDDVAHVLDDDDDVVVSDDDEVNPSTNVEEMACVFPRSHGGDAGGSPPRRPNRPVPAQCESSNQRIETRNASLKRAFRQNGQRSLTIDFDYGDLGTFHPTGDYSSMLNSLMGETVKYLPLACEWEEIPEAYKAHIFPTLESYFDLASWYNNQDKVVMGNNVYTVGDRVKLGLQLKLRILWRKNKQRIKADHFTRYGSAEEARNHLPPKKVWGDRTEDEWNKLVDWWSHPDRVARSLQNAANRAKNMILTHQGKKSFAQGRNEYKVQKGHYDDLIETWRKTHSRPETGEFKTQKNLKRYLDMKSMQDQVRAGVIPYKTDQDILDEVVPSTNRQNMSGKGRKLPGGGSTSRRRGPQAFPDVISREEMDRILRQRDQEAELLRKQTAEAQQRAYLAALKADAAYQNSETMYGAIGEYFSNYAPNPTRPFMPPAFARPTMPQLSPEWAHLLNPPFPYNQPLQPSYAGPSQYTGPPGYTAPLQPLQPPYVGQFPFTPVNNNTFNNCYNPVMNSNLASTSNSRPELPRFIINPHNNDTRSVDELARDRELAGEDNDVGDNEEADSQQSSGDYSEDEEGDNEEVQDESEESD
ncbi:uncharacterized protein Tco_1229353 [Tanacetum coccineum]